MQADADSVRCAGDSNAADFPAPPGRPRPAAKAKRAALLALIDGEG